MERVADVVDREPADQNRPRSQRTDISRFLLSATHGFYEDNTSLASGDGTRVPWTAGPADAPPLTTNPLLRCRLALGGINGRRTNSVASEDGCLTGLEISTVDLRGTELVFLTPCEIGLGQKRCGKPLLACISHFSSPALKAS
jgi:hypothetical protein